MLNQQNKNKRKVKKSQILLLGSLLIFLGEIALSYNFIKGLKEDIFEDMKQLILGSEIEVKENDVVDNNVEVERKLKLLLIIVMLIEL